MDKKAWISAILFLSAVSIGYFVMQAYRSETYNHRINIYIDRINISGEKGVLSYDGESLFRGAVKLDDKSYRDEAYRLSSIYLVSLTDPIYVMRYQSQQKEDIKKTLSDLILINDRFKKYNSIDNDIFPVSFFNAYNEALDSQDDFFDTVSLDNARNFTEKLDKLNDSYIRDAQRIRDEMQAAVKRSGIGGETRIYQLDNHLTPDIISRDFDKMIENGRRISRELDKRRKCLDDSQYCREMDFTAKAAKPEPYLSSSDKEQAIQNLRTYEVKSRCWSSESGIVTVNKLCPDFFNYCFNYTDLPNDKRYEAITARYPFERSLLDRGVSVIPKNITTPYVCNDYTYQAIISNSSHYDEKLLGRFESGALSGRYPILRSFMDSITSLESEIGSSKIHKQSDYEELAIRYADLQNLFMREVRMDKDNARHFNDINRRYLELNGRFMDMPLFLNKIIYHDAINMISSQLGDKSSDRKQEKAKDIYLYFSRNNYSVFFMNFSPFVWRNPEKPEYFEAAPKTKAPNLRILDHSGAVLRYGEEKLIEWDDIFRNPNKGDFYSRYHEEFGFGRLLRK